MKIGRRAALGARLVLGILLGWAGVARATTVDVKVGGSGLYGSQTLVFSPSLISINVGDSVHFFDAGGQHNVDFTTLGVRCANGCSDQGGDGTPVDSAWSFTRTFNTAGTYPFQCDIHGPMYGMTGSITVHAAGTPGTLGFSQSSYAASETAGTVAITVQRTGGASGAVGVSYAATAGTAVAGTDFQPASGTLNWADGDSASKTFSVTILNDHTSDGGETVHLTLSSPTGGASLGVASATLTISDASASPGTLAFAQASYSVLEGSGPASIVVARSGGTSGAVSVHYATSAGTAIVGRDFQAASGTLSWAAGDGANKSFTVTILSDSAADGTETVNLQLSAPTGGAALGRSAAVLDIQDASGGGTPAAPTDLAATAQSTTEIQLGWHDHATNETAYHVEQQVPPGAFVEVPGSPLPANTTSFLVSGLQPATPYNYRVRAANGSALSAYSNVAGATTDTTPAPCVADSSTLCLDDQTGDKRFKVHVSYSTTQSGGRSGPGTAIPLSSLGVAHGGLFWFFAADNPEMLIKVINGCALGGSYWVFYAAGTNVGLTVTVIDTVTGHVRTYTNADLTAAAPVQDTAALACN